MKQKSAASTGAQLVIEFNPFVPWQGESVEWWGGLHPIRQIISDEQCMAVITPVFNVQRDGVLASEGSAAKHPPFDSNASRPDNGQEIHYQNSQCEQIKEDQEVDK
jgi:hypothetical protein